MKYVLFLIITVLFTSPVVAQPLPDLVFETTREGAMVLWERHDPNTSAAVVTISAAGGGVRYQYISTVRSHNETLLGDLQEGERVKIEEFAGTVLDGQPVVAATHRSAPYTAVWRVRLPMVMAPLD